jgi:hypothetical protein
MHILSNTPDPIIDQWISGELPASDRHMIFMRNSRFFLKFLNFEKTMDTGNWTKKEPSLYTTQSGTGGITNWVYDSFDDSIYMSILPQMKYNRYKG